MSCDEAAGAVGIGLLAGVAGTAAVSSSPEAKLRKRGASSASADAAGREMTHI